MIAVVRDGELSISQIEKVDFAYKGEWNIPFKFGFTKDSSTKIHLHVFEERHPEIEVNILFRDYLRSNPNVASQYAAIKKALLLDQSSCDIKERNIFPQDTLRKDNFIRAILQKINYQEYG